jgi:hypothetical protein
MEDQHESDSRRMRANRTTLATACVTCGRGFQFGEEIACCTVCGRFQHIACWEGNTCPHSLSARPAPSAADPPAPPVEYAAPLVSGPAVLPVAFSAPPEAVAAPAAANRPADDERFCSACGQIVKKAALMCRFCKAVLSERLAAAETPAPVVESIASNARNALIFGLVGLVILAPIFGSMAISSGNAALREMDSHPFYLGPRGKAKAGVALGWIGWGLLVLGIFIRAAAAH